MVNNIMTASMKADVEDQKGLNDMAARQRALEDIDRAKFGWYHVR